MNKRKQRAIRARIGQFLHMVLCISTGAFFLIMALLGVDVSTSNLGLLFVSYIFLCGGVSSLMVRYA